MSRLAAFAAAAALLLVAPGASAQDEEAPVRQTSPDGRLQQLDAAGNPMFDAEGNPVWEPTAEERAQSLFAEAVAESKGLAPGSTMWQLSVARKLEEALSLKPDFHEARYNLGIAYLQGNDVEGAVRHLEQVMDARPDLTDARVALGVAYERQGRLSQAELLYGQGLGQSPDNVDLLNGQARVLLKRGRPDDASRAARAILRINSNSLDAFNTLGLAYMELERYETARFVFQKAKSLPGGDASAMLEANLGLVYWRMGKEFQATASFEAALALDPNHVGARVNLAHLRLVNLDYAGAHELLEPAAKQYAGNEIIQLSYAVSLRGIGKLEEAEAIYELIAGDPDSDLRDEALLNLGILQGDFLKDYGSSIDTYNEYIAVRETLGDPVGEDDPVHEYIGEMEKLKRKEDRRRQRESESTPAPEPEPEPAPEEAPAEEGAAPDDPAPAPDGGQ